MEGWKRVEECAAFAKLHPRLSQLLSRLQNAGSLSSLELPLIWCLEEKFLILWRMRTDLLDIGIKDDENGVREDDVWWVESSAEDLISILLGQVSWETLLEEEKIRTNDSSRTKNIIQELFFHIHNMTPPFAWQASNGTQPFDSGSQSSSKTECMFMPVCECSWLETEDESVWIALRYVEKCFVSGGWNGVIEWKLSPIVRAYIVVYGSTCTVYVGRLNDDENVTSIEKQGCEGEGEGEGEGECDVESRFMSYINEEIRRMSEECENQDETSRTKETCSVSFEPIVIVLRLSCSKSVFEKLLRGDAHILESVSLGEFTVSDFGVAMLFGGSFPFDREKYLSFSSSLTSVVCEGRSFDVGSDVPLKETEPFENDANEPCSRDVIKSVAYMEESWGLLRLEDSNMFVDDPDLFVALAYAEHCVEKDCPLEGIVEFIVVQESELDISFVFRQQNAGHDTQGCKCVVFVGHPPQTVPVLFVGKTRGKDMCRFFKSTAESSIFQDAIHPTSSVDSDVFDSRVYEFLNAFQPRWEDFRVLRSAIQDSGGAIPHRLETSFTFVESSQSVEQSGLLQDDLQLALLLLFSPVAFKKPTWIGDACWSVDCGNGLVRKITFRIAKEESGYKCSVSMGHTRRRPTLQLRCQRVFFINLLEGSLETTAACASGLIDVVDIDIVNLFAGAFDFRMEAFHTFQREFVRQLQEKMPPAEEDSRILSSGLEYIIASWKGGYQEGTIVFDIVDVSFPCIVIEISETEIRVVEEENSVFPVLARVSLPIHAMVSFVSGRLTADQIVASGWVGQHHLDLRARFPSTPLEARRSKKCRRRKRREEYEFIEFCSHLGLGVESFERFITGEPEEIEPPPEEKLEEAFMFLPYSHNPVDWDGVMQYSITICEETSVLKTVVIHKASYSSERGAQHLSVEGKQGNVEVLDGWPFPARKVGCTVTLHIDDFLRIAEGSLSPVMAFSQGKIQVDDLGALLSYSSAFTFDRDRYLQFVKQIRAGKSVEDIRSEIASPTPSRTDALRRVLKTSLVKVVQVVGYFRQKRKEKREKESKSPLPSSSGDLSGDSRGPSPVPFPSPRRPRGISLHSPQHQHHPKPPFKRQESIVSVAQKPSRPRASTLHGMDASGSTISKGNGSSPMVISSSPDRSSRLATDGMMIPIPDSPIDDFSLLVGDAAVPFEKIMDQRKKKTGK